MFGACVTFRWRCRFYGVRSFLIFTIIFFTQALCFIDIHREIFKKGNF